MDADRRYFIQVTALEKAELVELKPDTRPLEATEMKGRTLVSLVSPGTEIVGIYSGQHYQLGADKYPKFLGYAAVMQVESVGSAVNKFKPGDIVFVAGRHASCQRVQEQEAVAVPPSLAPEIAVFGRMAKIPMPAFVRSGVRPPEKVLVTGLGVVGLMAAQLAQLYGYETLTFEPNPARRAIAREHGITGILEKMAEDSELTGTIGLGVECSGHEMATLQLCQAVRKLGEVSMVGVPWVAKTDMLAQKILHAVFYNYINLHSGWEGNMPESPAVHSDHHHLQTAIRWLAEGRLTVKPSAYRKVSPENPQLQYQDILNNRLETLSVVFDWRMLDLK